MKSSAPVALPSWRYANMANVVYSSNNGGRAYQQLSRLQIAQLTSKRIITPEQYEALTNVQISALAIFAEKSLGITTHRH